MSTIYILMIPGWDEGEEAQPERAFIDEVKAESVAKSHPRGCAYVVEIPLEGGEPLRKGGSSDN